MRALRRGGVCAWGGRGSAPSRGFLEPRRLAVHRQEHAVEQDERHHDPVEPRIPYQRYAQPSRGMLLSEYPQRFLGQLLRRSDGVKGARASRSVDRVPSFTRCGGRSMIVFRRGAAFGARGGRVGSRRGRTIGPRPVKIVDTRVPHADSQCARGVAATSGERRAMRTSNFTFLSTAGGFMCFRDAPAAAGPPCRLLGAGMLPPGPAPTEGSAEVTLLNSQPGARNRPPRGSPRGLPLAHQTSAPIRRTRPRRLCYRGVRRDARAGSAAQDGGTT